MKLYATIQNENWKRVSKGGNEKLTVGLNRGNNNVATIDFNGDEIKIWYEGNHYWSAKLQGNKQKGEVCQIHGTQYIERHKLDGHYICRACVVDSIK